MRVLLFRVPGIPLQQDRPRAFTLNGHARLRDPKRCKDWKAAVAMYAKIALTKVDRWELDAAMHVQMTFHLPRPKTVTRPHHTVKPDLDNLEKAILDAMTGIVYKDDCQVISKATGKLYALAEPGVEIVVQRVE